MDLISNPKFRDFIESFRNLLASTQQLSLDEARKQCTAFFCPPNLPRESVHSVRDVHIKGRDEHLIPLRIYHPEPRENLPVMIYYHRGGWVFCNIEEADPVCRRLAKHLGCIVVSVDYRLAPENPFPLPFNDCYDAYMWVADNTAELGADPEKIIVCGESAGGNMAAAVSLRARNEDAPSIAAQLLIYPIISSTLNPKAYEQCADQYFMTKDSMQFFWSVYAQKDEDKCNPYASPDLADNLQGLPPALIVTAEHDPLRIEDEAYAKKLEDAGNMVVLEQFQGVIHGFLDLPIYTEDEITQWLSILKARLSHLMSFKYQTQSVGIEIN